MQVPWLYCLGNAAQWGHAVLLSLACIGTVKGACQAAQKMLAQHPAAMSGAFRPWRPHKEPCGCPVLGGLRNTDHD